MKKPWKRLSRSGIALILSVAMVFTMIPNLSYALAQPAQDEQITTEEQVDNAKDGDGITDADPGDETGDSVTGPSETVTETEGDAEESGTAVPAGENEGTGEQPEQQTPAAGEGEDGGSEGGDAEEAKYPAASFEKKADGMTVRIKAPEGALPEGASVKVEKVPKKGLNETVQDVYDEDTKVYKAVDITFYDKDGEKTEPKKEVSVSFASPDLGEIDKARLIHVTDDGDIEKVAGSKVDTDRNKATFSSDEFSVYAIIGVDEIAVLTINFYNGDTKIDTMYVKESDTEEEIREILYDPGAGEVGAGQVFRGWSDGDPDYTAQTTPKTIAGIRSDAGSWAWDGATDETWDMYAMIFDIYHVSYRDENGTIIKNDAVYYNASVSGESQQQYTVNADYSAPDDDHDFQGWNVVSGEGNISGTAPYMNGTDVTLTGDVVFSVNAPEGKWLTFSSGRHATYVPPQFIKSGETTSRPSDPVRVGYTFDGWYENEAGTGSPFVFGRTLTARTQLFAKWTKVSTAQYTVIIWKQNVDGDGYDFEESIKLTGNVDSTINTVTGLGNGNNRYARVNGQNKQYTGFHLDTFDTGVTIAPEGTSILNVYFNRNEYTFTFQVYDYTYTVSTGDNDNNPAKYGVVNGQRARVYWNNGAFRTTNNAYGTVYTGTVYTRNNSQSWQTIRTITKLYQQSIAEYWPIAGTNGITYDNGERWMPQNSALFDDVLIFLDIMPAESITFRLNTATHTTKRLRYYVEALPGDNVDTTFNGRNFVLINTINANLGYIDRNLDWLDLVGYTKFGSDPEFPANGRITGNVDFYYTRDLYDINFMDGAYFDGNGVPQEEANRGQLKDPVEGIGYGADISSYNKDGSDYFVPKYAGYHFAGWYIDKDCTHEYTFNKMPAASITVYAKWVKTQYRVFLHPNVPRSDIVEWAPDQQMSFRVNHGEKIADGNMILGHRVGYELMGWYMDEACTRSYNFDAYELNDTVASAEYDQTEPTELDDYGDPLPGQATYNSDAAGNRTWITKKLDLYAKWRKTIEGADGINVIYDAGEGSGAPQDENLYLDNTDAIAQNAPSTVPEGKKFLYWTVQAWDESAGGFVDTNKNVYPADDFTVFLDSAKVTENPGSTALEPSFTYEVQLIAKYEDIEKETPTHIDWYANNETDAVEKNEHLKINQPVDIPTAESLGFTYDGYEFVGWARYENGASPASPTDQSNLWLHYDGSGFKENGTTGVTQVAADERDPYHDLYAVWKKKVEITVKDRTRPYSGSEQEGYDIETVTGTGSDIDTEEYKVEGLLEGDVLTVVYAPAHGTDVGTYTNGSFDAAQVKIMRGSTDVTDAYKIKTTEGNLKILKAEITVKISGNNDTKTYDGQDHTASGFTVDETTIPSDADFTAADIALKPEFADAASVTARNKGKTDMGLTADMFTVESEKYVVVFEIAEDGCMKIEPRPLKITAASDEKVYDGTPLTNGGYEVSEETPLAGGDSISEVTVTGSQTVAGESGNAASGAVITNAGGDDVTGNYEITYESGKLKVTKRPLTITADSDTKVYDGTALTKNTYTSQGLAAGDRIDSVQVTGSQIPVGSSANTPSGAVIKNADNVDVTESYEILYATGNLEVTKRQLTITAAGDTKVYDGTPLTNDGYTPTGLATGDSVQSVTITGSQTPAGESENLASDAVIVNANQEDVTANYAISYQKGTLVVTKKPLTITAATDSKIYDGTPLTNSSYTNSELAAGDTITGVTVTGSQTPVGSSANTPDAAVIVNAAAEDVTESYEIEYVPGTLTVTEYEDEIVVTTTGGTFTYDGQPHGATVEVSALPDGYTVETAASSASATDVTEEDVAATCDTLVIKNAQGVDVTDKLNITKIPGTIKIIPRPLTVTTQGATKQYDGLALTNTEGASVTGFADGESAEITVTGSQTPVGESDNTYTLAWADGTKASNYTITENLGKLIVTENEAAITIKAPSAEKVYDGTALTKTGPLEAEGLPAGFSVIGSASGTITNVGTANNVVNAGYAIMNAENVDVTEYFANVTTENGTLEVTKAPLTIATGSAEKEYDGTALTEGTATITGLVNGETAAVTATGARIPVGSSSNTYSIEWGDTNKDNYEITEELGTLLVKPNTSEITLTAPSAEKVYDGTPLTCDGTGEKKVTAEGLPDGFTVVATAAGTITNVGTEDNVIDSYVILDENDVDVTEFFTNVKTVKGTLEVTKRPVTFTGKHKETVYSGAEQSEDGITVSSGENEGLLSGHTHNVEYLAKGTDAGTYDGEITAKADVEILDADGEDVTGNYDITTTADTLVITKAPLTITVKDQEYVYNGQPQGENNASYTDADEIAAKVTVSGLVGGDELASVTLNGRETDKGEYPDKIEVTAAAADFGHETTKALEDNYDVEYVSGKLTITKAEITVKVTGNTDTKAYTGAEQSVTGYTLAVEGDDDGLYDAAKVSYDGDATARGTVVNDDGYPMGLDADKFSYDDPNLEVTFVIESDGKLTITPVPLTIKANDDTKVYDGTPLTNSGYEITAGELKGSDEIESVTVTGSQTVVGTGDNTASAAKIVDANGEDVTSSYTITYEKGELKVTKRSITITAADDTKKYDGTPLTNDGYSITSGALATGDVIDSVTVTGTITDFGTEDNVPSGAKIVNAGGEDVTSSYDIAYVNGTLEITKAPITITTDSDSKVYDGTALTAGGKVEGIVEGETYTFTVTGSQTEVGDSPNTYTLTWDGTAKEENYEITSESIGTLVVTENTDEIVVTTTGGTFTYDGQAHGATVEVSELPAGYTLETATSSATATDVEDGTVEATCDTLVIKNAQGVDVTDKLNIRYVDGTIRITPKTLTIITGGAEKKYDGTPLTSDEVTVDGLVGEETATVTTTGSQTEVGEGDNTYEITWGTAKESNYTIDETLGKLQVTENDVEITITAPTDTKVYDGTALTADGTGEKKITVTGLPAGITWMATAAGSQTDAGSSPNTISAYTFFMNGQDVTENFTNVKTEQGTLTVEKKTLTIITGGDEKKYDGTPLTSDEVTVDGLVGEETATVTTTGSQTDVGDSDNTYEITWGTAKEANYTIDETLGKLAVTKTDALVTLTAPSAEKEYDGTPLTADGSDADNPVTAAGLPDGFTIQAAATGSQTVAGTGDNIVDDGYKIFDADENDVTAFFTNVQKAKGELVVTPKAVTIIAASDEKVYDGTALTNDGYEVSGDTPLAEGDSVKSVTVEGSQTVVGTGDNIASEAKIQNAAGEDVTSSYTITYEKGELIVTPKAITIIAASDEKVYDGTALTNDGYEVSEDTPLAEGDSVKSVTVEGSQTVVGTGDNVASEAKIQNAAGEDVTASYTITYEKGELIVTPKAITIIAASDEKVYDGTPLTNDGYEVSADTPLATGDSVDSVTVEGSQTVYGSSDNVASDAKIVNATGTDVTSSYTITYEKGELEVTKRPITITAEDDTKTYDGTALTNDGYSITEGTLADGDDLDSVTVTGTITDFGTEDNVPSGAKIVNAGGEDVTESYDIAYVNGTLKITKAPITITTDSDSKVYDGTALTADGEVTGIVEGETYTFTVTGSQTEVGDSPNTYTLTWDGTAKEENYEITSESIGTLVVTEYADEIVVTTTGGTFTYDGQAHGATVDVSELPAGYTLETAASSASATDVDDGEVAATCDTLVIKNAQGVDVTDKLNITKIPGTIKVTPASVTITTGSGTKEYDGLALTNDEAEITGLVNGEIATVTATGSQTDVGESTNTYDISWDTAKASNYTVTEDLGKLKVTVNDDEITITAPSAEKVYDGTPLTADGTDEDHPITVTGLPAGIQMIAKATGSQTNAGTGTNSISEYVFMKDGKDVTEYFTNVSTEPGTLTVTKAPVTITVEGASKTYGEDDPAFTGTVEGLVSDGDLGEISYVRTNTDEDAGTYEGVITAKFTENGNYDVTVVPADFVIEQASAETSFDVTKPDDTKYNGTEQKQPVVVKDKNGNTLTEGKDYTLDYGEDATNAGTVTVTITGIGNYTGTVTTSYEITKREVTLTSVSAEKVYDGKPLKDNTVIVGGDGFAEGEETEYVFSDDAQITDVGTVTNAFSYEAYEGGVKKLFAADDAAGDDLIDMNNYEITKIEGTLKVTPATLIVKTQSKEKQYDGKPLTAKGSVSGLVNGETVTFKTTGSQIKVGKSKNTYTLTWDGTAKEKNYIIKEELGTLKVSKADNPSKPPKDDYDKDGNGGTKSRDDNDGSGGNSIVRTGDPFDIAVYMALMLAAMLVMFIILMFTRRRKEDEQDGQ